MTEERSLKELLAFLPRKEILGNEAVNINKIEYDSRNVVEGDIFVALTGANLDGHDFVPQALEKGARCVVSERPLELPGGVVGVVVADSRHALSLLAAKYYDFPSRKMKVIGITGTNGKSTVAHLVRTIYETNHRQAGLIGTIEYIAGTHKFNAMNTTPESLQIEQLLTIMLAQRIRVCVMEVSSHALKSGRVRMIDFNTVGITNITQDHLDFHHDMEDYKTTKAMIFDKVKGKDKWAVLNMDDPEFDFVRRHVDSSDIYYSIKSMDADVHAKQIRTTTTGSKFDLVTPMGESEVNLQLVGEHNVSNAVCAAALVMGSGMDLDSIVRGLEAATHASGRLEPVPNDAGLNIYVDYAHTPDALENVCRICKKLSKETDESGRQIRDGDLVVVYGCGGDRDRTKRKLMSEAVCRYADRAVLTSDNPRTEDPMQIINDARQGLSLEVATEVIPDREKAIATAVAMCHPDDVLLVAGKGHETYQIIGKEKIDFDDRVIIKKYLNGKA